MFSFAKSFVKTLEHSAESIIGGSNDETIFENDSYFSNTSSKVGFRVLSVKQDSAASEKGVESWFDYIVGINNYEIPTNYNEQHQLVPNIDHFIKAIENNKSRSVSLTIWNAKGGVLKYIDFEVKDPQQLNDVPIDPSPSHIIQQSFERLGLVIQWTPLITSTFVYHVLEINPNSPAERAGLLEHSDYIVGAQDGLLATGGEDLLSRLITSKKNQSLILYVYNHDYDIVRPVTINPTDNWGGSGLLGCGVGYGLLHRLPPVVLSNLTPGSVLYDQGSASQESFHPINNPVLPAHQIAPPVSSSSNETTSPGGLVGPPPIHARKKKVNTDVKNDLLDYLQTEGEKSRKIDSQGRTQSDDSPVLPPPPKKN